MKLLKEVPFDKLYVGMPVCCLSPYESTKGEIIQRGTITNIIKDIKSVEIEWYQHSYSFLQPTFKHTFMFDKELNGTYLDPTRM